MFKPPEIATEFAAQFVSVQWNKDPAQSKNSSGVPMVVLQEPTEPFAAANRPVLRHAFL